jgi:hypothetical protein
LVFHAAKYDLIEFKVRNSRFKVSNSKLSGSKSRKAGFKAQKLGGLERRKNEEVRSDRLAFRRDLGKAL